MSDSRELAPVECEQEQIHLPQAIQPHGLFLQVEGPSMCLRAISDNCVVLLGHPAASLLGRPLADILGHHNLAALEALQAAASARAQDAWPIHLAPNGAKESHWEATAHLAGSRLTFELEPLSQQTLPASAPHYFLRQAIAQLRSTNDLTSLCQQTASLIRTLTGFDRVLVYRFDANNDGLVVAEAKAKKTTSLLGVHFPAGDVPKQARELYATNTLRCIPQVPYEPAAIVALAEDAQAKRIDLTQAILRSVSPAHRQYMENMGSTAAMSVSLMHEKRLWGLITCSHQSGPRRLSFAVRATCDALASVTAVLIESKERDEDSAYKLELKMVQSRLLARLTQTGSFIEPLTSGEPNILHITGADGAAVYHNQILTLIGKAPSEAQTMALLTWLREEKKASFYVSDSLPKAYPAATAFSKVACGLVAASFAGGRNSYVLWFRQEVLQTKHWGGDPAKAKSYDHESMRYLPRKSFAAYQHKISLTSLPWKDAELQAATDLLQSINELVLIQSEELQRVNKELARSNTELDAFAHAASHDLKEPLRGIHNYTELALEELGPAHLVGQSAQRLATVVRLTQRMEDLINSLLHYSHVGRAQLTLQKVDLNEVVAHVKEMIRARLEETGAELRLPRHLPSVLGDPVLIGELFANLITNAIKYNDKDVRWVEVAYIEQSSNKQYTVIIRDNGIGIERRNQDDIFKIFRRLHARDKFGGGTGTGLTIARRIVEKHGGEMWVKSDFGAGSAFFFTLAPGAAND